MVYALFQVDEAAGISQRFEKCLEDSKTKEMPYGSVLRACWNAFFWPRFALAGGLQLLFCLVRICDDRRIAH